MVCFLGLDGPAHSAEGARVAILPVPYDATTSFHAGARHAPEAALTASHHIEEYDEELGREICDVGIHTAEPVEPDLGSPEAMVRRVEARVDGLLSEGKRVITLGGDHTVAVGAVWAHASRFGPLSVLQVDAHADLRDAWEGSRFSHACAARRMGEHDGVERVVAVGVRAISPEGVALTRGGGRGLGPGHPARPDPEVGPGHEVGQSHEVFFAQALAERDPADWISEVIASLRDRVYVTFDVDGFDPSVVPATGTPEPGGLSWWTTLRLLRQVSQQREVVGADVCELCPAPGLHASDVTVARLLYKMIGYFWP